MPKRVGNKDDVPPNFLQKWRKARGYTQESFAEEVGTTKATISRTEGSKQTFMPAAQKLYADKLGTHPSILLSRGPTPEEAPPRGTKPRPMRTAKGMKKRGRRK